MVENTLKVKADNPGKKKKKEESIDETNFQKTNINNIEQKLPIENIDKEVKKPTKVQPKEEKKEKIENVSKKEERKDIENVKASVRNRKRLPSYYEKYPKKPKQTFYSTSKNPKINQILNKLRQNGEIKLKDDTKEVGKIDSDKIGKYNRIVGQEEYKWGNKKKGIAPKIKDYLDKLNSSGQNSAMISNNQLPSITETNRK